MNAIDTGQDRIKAFATAINGCVMLNTEVVYGRNIGQEGGLNFTPSSYKQWRLDKTDVTDETLSLDFDLSSVNFDPWHPGCNVQRLSIERPADAKEVYVSDADAMDRDYSRKRENFLPWEAHGAAAKAEQRIFHGILRRKAGATIGEHTFISPEAHVYQRDEFSIGRASYVAAGAILRGRITIGDNSTVNAFAHIAGLVSIGNGVRIAGLVSIYGFNHGFDRLDVPIYQQPLTIQGVKIGDGTWIGANVTIIDGVTIGEHCIVGGGAVVTKDFPDFFYRRKGIQRGIIKSSQGRRNRRNLCRATRTSRA